MIARDNAIPYILIATVIAGAFLATLLFIRLEIQRQTQSTYELIDAIKGQTTSNEKLTKQYGKYTEALEDVSIRVTDVCEVLGE